MPSMTFVVAADSYDRFMGRFSVPLSAVFADFARVEPGLTALDVGCGPGALTAELVRRLGAGSVAAADPSEPFVAAAVERNPGVDVRLAPAERLPFDDDGFDRVLAQLVVQFMEDPDAGAREMRRVARGGGLVAACVWDHGGDRGPVSPFWQALRTVEGDDDSGESRLVGVNEGDLTRVLTGAGLDEVEETAIAVTVEHGGFDAWWEPFTLGVGPAGAQLARLPAAEQARVREAARAILPAGRFETTVHAWAARGRA